MASGAARVAYAYEQRSRRARPPRYLPTLPES
jgi:hypothetical protein